MSHNEIDSFWTYMESHLKILDAALSPVIREIETATKPIGEHLYDHSEYLFGAGFVAIQKYMLETCHQNDISVKKAVNFKALDEGKVPFEVAVWAAANYWKHDAEWWRVGFTEAEKLTKRDKDLLKKLLPNLEIISVYGDFVNDHVCSNILAAYTPSKELRLCSLLPRILDWRETVRRLTAGGPARP